MSDTEAPDPSTPLVSQSAGIPRPGTNPVSQPFWAGAAEGKLRYQWCSACSLAVMDPQPACTRCLHPDLEWRTSSGKGTISSYTVVWRAPLPSFDVPYAPAIITMAEGFSLLTNVVGCTVDALSVGAEVEVRFTEIEPGFHLPYVTPTPETAEMSDL